MSRNINFSSQIAGDVVEPFYAVDCDFSGIVTRTFYTKVMATGNGNKFQVDGLQQYDFTVARGNTVIFDQSDNSNTGHPLLLVTTEDGSTQVSGVTVSGTAGTDGKTTWVVAANAPDEVWYKCSNHSGMGARIRVVDPAVRLWTGYGNITIGSDTYLGSGELGGISSIGESNQIEAKGITLSLSGIPSNLMTSALYETYQNRNCTIYFGCLVNGQLTVAPYEIFTGLMDTMNVTQNGDTSNITLNVESSLINLKRTKINRFTDEDQQNLHTGDTSLRYVADLQNKEILWGIPYSQVPKEIKPLSQPEIDKIIEDIVLNGINLNGL
jgi:hypothetical protein